MTHTPHAVPSNRHRDGLLRDARAGKIKRVYLIEYEMTDDRLLVSIEWHGGHKENLDMETGPAKDLATALDFARRAGRGNRTPHFSRSVAT